MAVALAVAAVALLAAPARADAHAELTSTEPASGARLDAAPAQVVLTFTEAVEVAEDGVDVYAASGDLLDTPRPAHPGGDGSAVAVDLPELGDGAYVVSWRVTSSDSHPVSGAFTFAVGEGSVADADALMGDVLSDAGADPALGVVYGIDRFVAFAGIVLLVGGAAFVLVLWPEGLSDRRARRLLAAGWWAAAIATLVGIGLQGAYAAAGSLADAVDPEVVGDELGARVGRVWAVRLVLLAVVAVAARALARRRADADAGAGAERADDEVLYVGALLGLGILATVSFAGHAASGDLVLLALVTDVVHLAGVSAWLGGLALLLVAVLRRPAGPEAPDAPDVARLDRVVGRFSSLAFGAVVAIVASGVVQAWRQLGSFAALVDTTYGRLLVAKVVLVALMLVGAAASRAWVQAHVGAPAGATATAPVPGPALSPGPGAAAAGTGTRAGRDLRGIRRSVGAEAVLAVAVLAVTAGLVNAVPGETAQSGEGFAAEMHGTDVLVEAEVEPAEAGPVDVTVRALGHDGTPLDPEEVTASLSLPERELGPLDLTLEERGTGEFASSGAELPFPGEWELEVVVRTTDIDQDRLSTSFTVR